MRKPSSFHWNLLVTYFLPIFIFAYEDEGFPNESLEIDEQRIEREEEDIIEAFGNHFNHSFVFFQLVNKPTIN